MLSPGADLLVSRGWAVIADGMGGHEAGELASAAAIATIREMIGDAGSEFEIVRVLERANERIFEEMFDGRGRPAMGSTAVGIFSRMITCLYSMLGTAVFTQAGRQSSSAKCR